MTIPELIQLCSNEPGKVFIMDQHGNMKLVIMGAGEFRRLKGMKAAGPVSGDTDSELVNRVITRAQLEERGSAAIQSGKALDSDTRTMSRDMREEVIDPSFNFDGPDEI